MRRGTWSYTCPYIIFVKSFVHGKGSVPATPCFYLGQKIKIYKHQFSMDFFCEIGNYHGYVLPLFSTTYTVMCSYLYSKEVHNIDVVHYSLPIIMLRGAWQGVVVYKFLYEKK
jgi:hypothetical protein